MAQKQHSNPANIRDHSREFAAKIPSFFHAILLPF
jgi:hypothetical protein